MRFFFADPSVVTNLGHHANHCRYVMGQVKELGVPARVLANRKVSEDLQKELHATPLFRVNAYAMTDGDPFCGWLNAFMQTKEFTKQDLLQVTEIGRDDLVLFSGAQPAQLLGVIEWLAQLPADIAPVVALELGGEPGLDLRHDNDGETYITARDVRIDPKGVLYRYAGQFLEHIQDKPLHIFTHERSVSLLFETLMQRPVLTLPFPTPAITSVRKRFGQRPITIATVGHQQRKKGYHLVPDIARLLLASGRDVRLLIHNSDAQIGNNDDPPLMATTQEKMRELATADSRIVLDERSVEFDEWANLIDSCDIIFCPYDPVGYEMSHSGVASTCMANGIPMVVPAGTSLALWIEEFGEPGVTFDKFTPASVAASVMELIDNFDMYAARAHGAAAQWVATQGPRNFVKSLMALYEQRSR